MKANRRKWILWMSLAPAMLAALWGGGVQAAAGGEAVINPNAQKQRIADWGYDVKQGGKAEALTTSYSQAIFVTDKMTCLRVPIWGDVKNPAHPADGKIIDSYYASVLSAMANARQARKDVVFFASKKLEAKDSFPGWVKDATGVVPAKYARLLADYFQYMEARGFKIDMLGIDNEMEYNDGKITPEKHKDIIDDLRSLAKARGFAVPKIIGPDMYGPKADWLAALDKGGWGDRLDIAGTHYYPKWRKPAKIQAWIQAAGARPKWHTELHWDKVVEGKDLFDQAEAAFATIFDCTDNGFTGFVWWSYRPAGVKGELEQALVQSTAQARPIEIDGGVGKEIKYGGLITRAFREANNVSVWAINNHATKRYDSYGFRLAGGAISGDVHYQQWTLAGSTQGVADKTGGAAFKLTLPAKTFTKFTFGLQ